MKLYLAAMLYFLAGVSRPVAQPAAVTAVPTPTDAATACEAWRWRGRDISPPDKILRIVRLDDGVLTAVDNGEWGGGLEWSASSGARQTLIRDNVSALEPIDGGVLALSGLAHLSINYGYVTRVLRTATGWDVQEIARLPSQFSSISTVGADTYAAWSTRRVVIFSGQGMLGLAECQRTVPSIRPRAASPNVR
jgi:hypothetical protein